MRYCDVMARYCDVMTWYYDVMTRYCAVTISFTGVLFVARYKTILLIHRRKYSCSNIWGLNIIKAEFILVAAL